MTIHVKMIYVNFNGKPCNKSLNTKIKASKRAIFFSFLPLMCASATWKSWARTACHSSKELTNFNTFSATIFSGNSSEEIDILHMFKIFFFFFSKIKFRGIVSAAFLFSRQVRLVQNSLCWVVRWHVSCFYYSDFFFLADLLQTSYVTHQGFFFLPSKRIDLITGSLDTQSVNRAPQRSPFP